MRLYRKNRRFPYLGTVLSVCIFAVAIGLFLFYIGNLSNSSDGESRRMTEESIRKALVNCYAIEGVYPTKVDYLENNYGVIIDHDRYSVRFDALGGNIMPAVELIDLKAQ